MVEYYTSKKGYFYKLLKNGDRKRISKEEYSKRTKTKRQMGGNESIQEEDILYQDDLVCILKPEVKKGILVWSHYEPLPVSKKKLFDWSNFTRNRPVPSICSVGLKTGQQLRKEGIEFGRNVYHPYIFFRAPYLSNIIDYSTIDSEIESSYGKKEINIPNRVYIRVHPDKTFVFSSEIRTEYNFPTFMLTNDEYNEKMQKEVNESKKTLTEYLRIIKNNEDVRISNDNEKIMYHLHTTEKRIVPERSNYRYPWNDGPINENSEILVSIPHLTPEYFVHCT